jgi:hypothetical protein
VEVDLAALPLDLIDLALAVVLTASLQGPQLRIATVIRKSWTVIGSAYRRRLLCCCDLPYGIEAALRAAPAGIEPLEPGWARFRVAPRVTGALPGARIALHEVRGRVDVARRRQGSSLVLVDLRVPVKRVAEVLLPGGSATSSGQAPTGWTGGGGVGYRSCGATSPAIVGRRPG